MSDLVRQRLALAGVLLVSAVFFFVGIDWGLPARSTDAALFGDRTPWTGKQILSLAPAWNDNAARGADVDANPLVDRTKPILLNATDADRAELLRRYRLFSYQPDEMITFRSLSGMSPGQVRLDPKLYQYGGLWIYPVGALLKAASTVGLVTLTSDLAFYLDNPEQFGRFYIVARAYSAAWGLVAVASVFWIVRKLTTSTGLAAVGALCFAVCPVVVTMAHEAKPHLPGAALTLLACIAATKFVETRRSRWWVITGVLCGAAFGMVLSALWAFVVVPVMVLLTPDLRPTRRLSVVVLCTLVGILTYAATNPYVLINAITHPEVLRSNVGNSSAMYAVGRWTEGATHAGVLLMEAAGPGVTLGAGVVGLIALGRSRWRGLKSWLKSDHAVGLLLFCVCACVMTQFIALAAGKPGEYARFAIVPSAGLVVSVMVGIRRFARSPRAWLASLSLVTVPTLGSGMFYLTGFIVTGTPVDTRRFPLVALEAHRATARAEGRALVVGLLAEPAPYNTPPLNLFEDRIVLLPSTGTSQDVDVVIRVAERVWPFSIVDTPISWAVKPIVVEGPAKNRP